jgi:hypothetical protein
VVIVDVRRVVLVAWRLSRPSSALGTAKGCERIGTNWQVVSETTLSVRLSCRWGACIAFARTTTTYEKAKKQGV